MNNENSTNENILCSKVGALWDTLIHYWNTLEHFDILLEHFERNTLKHWNTGKLWYTYTLVDWNTNTWTNMEAGPGQTRKSFSNQTPSVTVTTMIQN